MQLSAAALVLALVPLTGPVPGAPPTLADEGMWTFDNPPLERLAEDHGFEPDARWLHDVQLASVRLNDGGSGSFVSPHGLVLTNLHVGLGAIQKLSSEERDLVGDGFYAQRPEDELRCTDLELNVLIEVQDVTERVEGAVAEGADEATAREQREAEIARIEQEATERSGRRCDVVSLYHGGVYALYEYEKHTDVRLVFSPESAAGFFGGDPDNFNYPRWCLDMALFRVWKDGAPLSTPHYLKWGREPVAEGDLVFVSGNPGSTGRLNTLAQLEYLRDESYPRLLRHYARRRAALEAYAALGEEQARRAHGGLLSALNSQKALGGYLTSLQDERALARKAVEERELRAFVAEHDELAAEVGGAWDAIAEAQRVAREIGGRAYYSRIRGSRLYDHARTIVRLTAELEKPNDERQPAYRDSALDSLKLGLYSAAPIYPDYEEAMIAAGLREIEEELGADDPWVRAASRVGSPVEAAAGLVQGTRLADPEHRRELVDGGWEAVQGSSDPMIRLALAVDPIARELQERLEREVESVETAAGQQIARARFAAYGTTIYPDATFTLRLSYGVVKGYELNGYHVPYKTTVNGLYDRAAAFDRKGEFRLADRWVERRADVDPDTPFNFVCTADIIGGNSGSPVIDRAGRLVGLIFDGNIQSLGNRFLFDDTVARAVAVHADVMMAALEDVYGAERLVDEIRAAAGAD